MFLVAGSFPSLKNLLDTSILIKSETRTGGHYPYPGSRTIVVQLGNMVVIMPLAMARLDLFTVRPNKALLSKDSGWILVLASFRI
jgi:hypothetical protein